MTTFNPSIHTVGHVDISLYSLDDLIDSLKKAKECILNEYPEAFQIDIEINESTLLITFFRNKTKEEIDRYQAYLERKNKIEYQKYLDLQRKYEGN